jgi:hypothetical protein
MNPNFLIIGAQKAGTTSLLNYLSRHPDIFVPDDKEISCFYDDKGYNSRFKNFPYEKYFSAWKGQKYAGNAPVNTMYFSGTTSKNIYSFNPEMKLIAILRNPIDRAYSAYWYFVHDGVETESFESALKREEEIIKRGTFEERADFTYVSHGYYLNQLLPFFELFEKNQILILFYDDFKEDPRISLMEIYSFLGLEERYPQELLHKKYNVASAPRFTFLHNLVYRDNLIKRVYKSLFTEDFRYNVRYSVVHRILDKFSLPANYPAMRTDTRMYLKEKFYTHNIELGKFLGKDLSRWNQ